METIALARNAMATRFEVVVHGKNPVSLRAAGEEALEEIGRVEAQLSLYRPTSEIAHVNARAAYEAVRVSPGVFRLLERAQQLHRESGGYFDITIAPLVRCWGFMGGTGSRPDAAALAEAREHVGMHLVELNPTERTVHFLRPKVMLDPGAIGKGYAVGRAAEILREAGVENALIHGGTSTVYAFGKPEEEPAWKVAIEGPPGADDRDEDAPLAVIPLRDEALSVSAVWGKSFEDQGRRFGHVLDPRTGLPVAGTVLAAVVVSSATESDALSTALLVLGPPGLDRIVAMRKDARALVVTESGDGFETRTGGIPPGRAGILPAQI